MDGVAILGFHDRLTEAVFRGRRLKGFPPDLFRATQRKLNALNAAVALNDLKVPASNRLHPLTMDRSGQHAIAVNDQFRICFVWTDGGSTRVEFTDYHR